MNDISEGFAQGVAGIFGAILCFWLGAYGAGFVFLIVGIVFLIIWRMPWKIDITPDEEFRRKYGNLIQRYREKSPMETSNSSKECQKKKIIQSENLIHCTELSTSGDSQVIHIPKEFWLENTEVEIKRVGSSLMITPRGHA